MEYRGYTIQANYYAGFAAVLFNNNFITLAGSTEGAKRFVDIDIDIYNKRAARKAEA